MRNFLWVVASMAFLPGSAAAADWSTSEPHAAEPAAGGGCQIIYNGASGDWRFVKVYDEATGTLILSTAIKAGEPKALDQAPLRIRIESKFAGDTMYRPGPTADCTAGELIEF